MISKKNFSEQSAFFARLSNVAYKPPTEAMQIFKKMNFTSTFYENGGSEAYVIENDNDIIVICRGTEPKEWADIQADLTIDRVNSRAGVGQVHRGFRNYTDKLWEQIKNHILDTEKTLWLTGHSLGAAMATLMARRFVLSPIDREVEALFTFGSPRVGNRSYINFFNEKLTHHRWVNDGDIVTKVPFSPWYFHCGTMHHIDAKGRVTVNFDRKTSWGRVLSLLLPHRIFKIIIGDAKDHSSELYVKHIGQWAVEYTGETK